MSGRNRLMAVDGSSTSDLKPPTDVEAEQQVVGTLLQWPDHIRSTADMLPAASFSDPMYRATYETMIALDRQGDIVDVRTVKRALAKTRAFAESIDNPAAFLAEAGIAVTTAANLDLYVSAVRESWQKRQLFFLTLDGRNNSLNCKKPREIIATLRAGIESLESDQPSAALTTEQRIVAWGENLRNRVRPPMILCGPIGSRLRELVIGEKVLTVLAGSSSHGKSALAHQLVFDALNQPTQTNLKALICSVEMAPEEIFDRQCARFTGIDGQQIMNRTYPERDNGRVEAGFERILSLADRIEFLTPPFSIQHVARRAEKFGAKLVLVDYLQRFTAEGAADDVRLQVNAIMDGAKLLAGQGRAVILISALNRGDYDPESISLSALRESGEIEYAADSVYFVVKADSKDEGRERPTALICAKNRNGPKGRMMLKFTAPLLTFEAEPQFTPHDDLAEFSDPEEGCVPWQ